MSRLERDAPGGRLARREDQDPVGEAHEVARLLQLAVAHVWEVPSELLDEAVEGGQ